MNGPPLSVIISIKQPQRHIMSLNNHRPMASALSFLSARASAQDDKWSHPCTIYLYPLEAGVIFIVSTCIV